MNTNKVRVTISPDMDTITGGIRQGTIVGVGQNRLYSCMYTGRVDVERPYRVELDNSKKVVLIHPIALNKN